LLRCLGKFGVALATTLLGVGFARLMYIGVQTPVMQFMINERPLYQPVGPLPVAAKKAVDILDLMNMLKSEVSVLDCIKAYAGWARDGEVNSAIGLVMWTVFVVGFTALDVLMAVLASWRLCIFGIDRAPSVESFKTYEPGSAVKPCPFMSVSRVLKKLAMLDVALVGIVLITYCMAIYKKIGVMVITLPGIWVLVGAEVVHIVAQWLVASVADYPAQAFSCVAGDCDEVEACPSPSCELTSPFNCFVNRRLLFNRLSPTAPEVEASTKVRASQGRLVG